MNNKDHYLLKLVEIIECKVSDLKCPGTDMEKIRISNKISKDIEVLKKAIKFEVNT